MKNLVSIIIFFSFIFGAMAQENKTIVLDPADFKKAIAQEDVQIIDVRTQEEFDLGSINDALNIDYFKQDLFNEEVQKLDKSKPVYIFCRSGNRSQKSAVILEQLGFEKIYELKGGYTSWIINE